MPKNTIADYSATAASNTDIHSVDIDEGCAPSGINNAIRELMADLADVNAGTVALTSPNLTAFSVGGTAVTATAAELNILDGVTATAAELNILDGVTSTAAELNLLDGVTATTAEINYLDGVTSNIQTQLDNKGTVSSLSDLGVTSTAAELNKMDGVTATTAELNYVDISTLGTSQASKVVTADANGNIKLSEEVQATAYIDTVVSLSGTTPTVDCDEGNAFTLTTSGNTTFSFSYAGVNLTTNDAYAFVLRVTAGGSHSLTWPGSVDWAGGTAPDAPASGETDVFVFFTTTGGTTWYGFLAGDALS